MAGAIRSYNPGGAYGGIPDDRFAPPVLRQPDAQPGYSQYPEPPTPPPSYPPFPRPGFFVDQGR